MGKEEQVETISSTDSDRIPAEKVRSIQADMQELLEGPLFDDIAVLYRLNDKVQQLDDLVNKYE